MFSFLARFLVPLYFRTALLLGFHRYVFRITSKWGKISTEKSTRCTAAASIQHLLVSHGYHCCPSCKWATEQPDEHINVQGSWCWEQSLPQCSCCGLPEKDCQMASEADIKAYYNEQQTRDAVEKKELTAAFQEMAEQRKREQEDIDAILQELAKRKRRNQEKIEDYLTRS